MQRGSRLQLLLISCITALSFASIFVGCGGGAPVSSGAGRYLKEAREKEEQAISYEQKGDTVGAAMMYREALAKVETGLKSALANERPPLRSFKERIASKITEMDMLEKLKQDRAEAEKKKAEDAKKVAALGKTNAAEDEDAKRKAAEEAKKKEAEDLREKLKGLTTEPVVKQPKAPEGDDDPNTKGTGDAGKTGDEPKKDDKPKPPEGPFKVYGENEKPPRLSVDKVEVHGEFIYAYIQIYNDDAANKRIARPEATFTTIQDADLCNADIYIQYSKFDKGLANPLDHTAGAITGSSHEVFANSAFQMVAIAQSKEKAGRARKAKATIMFEDGNSWTVRGPEDAKPTAVDSLPGL